MHDHSAFYDRLGSPQRDPLGGIWESGADRTTGRTCDGEILFLGTGPSPRAMTSSAVEAVASNLDSSPPEALNRYELNARDGRGNLTSRADIWRGATESLDTSPTTPKDRQLSNTFKAGDELIKQFKNRLAPDGSAGGAGATGHRPWYDRAGNMISDGRKFRYVYDSRNQLVGVYRRQANGDFGAIFGKFNGLRSEPREL